MTKELHPCIWMSRSVKQGLCLINASTASFFSSLLSFFFFTIFLMSCQQGEWKICLTMLFFGWISLLFLAHVSVEQIISGLDETDWDCRRISPQYVGWMHVNICLFVSDQEKAYICFTGIQSVWPARLHSFSTRGRKRESVYLIKLIDSMESNWL